MDNAEKHPKLQRFADKFTAVSVKIGNEVHLRSLRDAFSTIMPMFILAGLGVLASNVIFPWLIHGEALAKWQVLGTVISNGTLNIASVLIAPTIAFYLAKNKGYESPISTVPLALASLFVLLAVNVALTPIGAKKAVDVTGAILYNDIGTQGMFAGIIVGLLGTEIYMRLAKVKQLKISLGSNVPPAVAQSFNVMIPTLLVVTFFAVISTVLAAFGTNLLDLIRLLLQEPLRKLNTSLAGFLFIYSCGNFLYALGIHQTTINGVLLDPVNLLNMNENMAAVAAGKQPTHIINSDFVTVYTQMGGTGLTFALILAVLIFARKYKPYRNVIALSTVPGIFEINEPIIFGFPIVFNIPMMIPFVLAPVIGGLIGYFFTAIGFVAPLSVYIPWTTPPLISGLLASGGDWKVVLVQVIILVVCTLFYVPFIKVAQRVAEQSAALDLE